MGKSVKTLTNHKKAIRALAIHPEEYTFASAAADNIKVLDSIRSGSVLKVNLCAISPGKNKFSTVWLSTDKMCWLQVTL